MRAAVLLLAALLAAPASALPLLRDHSLWRFTGPATAANSVEGGLGCPWQGGVAVTGVVDLMLVDRLAEDGLVLRFDLDLPAEAAAPCVVRVGPGAGGPHAGWRGSCVDPHVFCRWSLVPATEDRATYAFILASTLGLQGWFLHAPSLPIGPLALPA